MLLHLEKHKTDLFLLCLHVDLLLPIKLFQIKICKNQQTAGNYKKVRVW